MQKLVKLKQNRDFRRLYSRGKAFVSPFFVVYLMKNRSGTVRLGITAGKKVGGAVQRNRAKRVIRAAFRECLPHLSQSTDAVIVARSRILGIKSTDAVQIMKKQFTEAGIWVDEDAF